MKRRQRQRWFWIGIALLLSFILLEVGLRVTFGLGNPVLLQADPEIGYLIQPNQLKVRFGKTIKINQFSQRSDPITPSKPPQTLRILMTGDSILNGGTPTNQDQTITAYLEAALRQTGRSAEVLNASAGSWGIGNHLAYLRRFGWFESDLFIIEIGDNDLMQPTSTSYRVGRSPDYPDRRPVLAVQELIYRYLWPRFATLLKIAPPPSEIPTSDNPVLQAQLNQALLRQIIVLARSQNLPILAVLVPQRYHLLPTVYISTEKQQFLETLNSLNVPAIDLQTIWAKLPEATIQSYFRDTDHLTPKGNQTISELILQEICIKRHLVRCQTP